MPRAAASPGCPAMAPNIEGAKIPREAYPVVTPVSQSGYPVAPRDERDEILGPLPH